jgi:triosephosphate isomerase (TIM)
MVRRRLVAGNWKMVASRDRLAELDAIDAAAGRLDLDVALCPPFPLIGPARDAAPGIHVGGQDCHHLLEGAHTGSTSPALLRDFGAAYVIVGHSERRKLGETDAQVSAKAAAAHCAGLVPIICVGESAEQRRQGDAAAMISHQVCASLPAAVMPERMVIAYEPLWAIGSGRTPSAVEIAEMHHAIRASLVRSYGMTAHQTRILYGGSVNPRNAGWISAIEGVDGLLVGACSLTAADFVPILEAAAAAGVSVPAAA